MNENDWMHADMTGWNVLITGGNSGIGYAYARIAVNNNANVTIACRNENHARTACMVLNGLNEDNKVDYLIMDMAEPDKAQLTWNDIMSAVYPASDIRFHAMHPGVVNSRFKDKMHGLQHAYMNAIFTLFGDEPAVPARSIQRLIMDDSTGGYWYDDMTVWHADNLHASQELTC